MHRDDDNIWEYGKSYESGRMRMKKTRVQYNQNCSFKL